jgi:hypothetical protein
MTHLDILATQKNVSFYGTGLENRTKAVQILCYRNEECTIKVKL